MKSIYRLNHKKIPKNLDSDYSDPNTAAQVNLQLEDEDPRMKTGDWSEIWDQKQREKRSEEEGDVGDEGT